MKLILNRPVTDRINGKAVTFDAGTAVEFPDEMGQALLDKGYAHDGAFPKNQDEKDMLAEARKHPALLAAAPQGNGKK
jgi:hypothetical protein